MSRASIIGAYNTQFGAFVKKDKATGLVTDTKTYYDLLIEAGRGAIADAGLDPKDIDAIYVGSCSPGSTAPPFAFQAAMPPSRIFAFLWP